MESRPHAPVRSCIGCRAREEQSTLMRLTLGTQGEVLVDRGTRAPGRGAYLHPREACIQKATSKGQLQRAFKGKARPGADLTEILLQAAQGWGGDEAAATGCA